MSDPVSIPSRPPLARSLLVGLSITFAACLITFGLAVHFLIVVPATQTLARVQLDLATAHIQSEAERSFRRIEIQLGTARALGQSGRLRVDDRAGFDELMAPLLRDESRLGAIHLATTDGRRITLSREGDAPCAKLENMLPPSSPEAGTLEGTMWSPPFLAPGVGDGCITLSTRWRGSDGRARILAFDISLAELSRLTLDTPVGERGGSTVLTSDGDIVGGTPEQFRKVIAESDFVTIHLPKTKETTGLIGTELLSKAKPELRVINVARGGIVDDAALVWVVHDTNPHALSPKVKKFVQAQHWFQDLTQIGLE